MRTRASLRPSTVAIVFSLLAGAACAGKEVSIGSNQSQLTHVDPATVTGAIAPCAQGNAHPNVCCQAGLNTPSACGVYNDAPFHACDDGWKTYPDPRACCDLNDPTKCAPPPPPPTHPPPVTCGYACPPGWFTAGPDTCCRTNPDGSGECYGSASTGRADAGVADAGDVDGGSCTPVPPEPVDAGILDAGPAPDSGFVDAGPPEDGGCAYPPPPPYPPPPGPPPAPPPCDEQCPPGWVQAQGAPDVCCREEAPGVFACFSQAGGGPPPPPPIAVDAGPPTIGDGGIAPAPRACSGSSNGDCGCSDSIGGHTYDVSCSNSTATCTCTKDGVSTTVTGRTACSSGIDAVWTNDCNFP